MIAPAAHHEQLVKLSKCIKVLGSAWQEALQELHNAQRNMLELNSITINSAIRSCALAGEWQQALWMLSQMTNGNLEPDVISFTVAMTSCKREQRWPEAILVLADAQDSAVSMDKSLCTTAVSICSKANSWEKALVTFHTASHHGIRADNSMHNSLVVTGGKDGDSPWTNSVEQLAIMRELDVPRSAMSFGSMISCCGNCGEWTGSIAFLHEMHLALGLTLPACTSAVIACVKGREGGSALRLLDQMVVSQLLPTLVTYGGALAAARDDWATALSLFQHLRLRHEIVPDAACYVAAISACVRGQQWAISLDFLSEALEKSLEMGNAVFGSILGALENHAKDQDSEELLRLMRTRQLEVNGISFGTAISVAHRSGRWYRALGLYQDLWHFSMESDALTLSDIISASGAGLFWSSAMGFLEKAQQRQLQLDARQSNACIAVGRGHWQLSLELLHAWHAAEDTDAVSYNSALAALEQGQQWRLAISEISEFQARSLEMDSFTCSSALGSCDAWFQALQWLQRAQWQHLETSSVVCNAATSACSKGDQWQHAVLLSLDSLEAGAVGGDQVPGFNALLQATVRSNQWQKALELWKLPQHGPRSVNSFSWLLTECEQRSLAGEEFSLLEELRSTWLWAGEGLVLLPAEPQLGQWQAELKKASWEAVSYRSRPLLRPIPASLAGAASGAGTTRAPYWKELRLLRHVLQSAEAGDAMAVCNSIETFGNAVLGISRSWLKVAGGPKAAVLRSAVQAAPPLSSVLEIGTYCGYSSLRLAMAVPGVRVVTIDVDPAHVLIARNVIAFAGFEPPAISVWTGHSSSLLPRLCQQARERAFGMVFMDQRGSLYHEDLQCLENGKVLHPGAVIVADNVLKPGAPLLLWRLAVNHRYCVQQLSMPEFAMPVEDWMAVAVVKDTTPQDEAEPESPALLWELHNFSDEIRSKALLPGRGIDFLEWKHFAARMKEGLKKLGITSVPVTIRAVEVADRFPMKSSRGQR